MLRLRRALTRHGSITPFPEPASSTIATEARCSDVSRRFFAKLAILDVTKGTVIEWKGKPAVVTSMIHTKGLARQLGKVELQLRDLRSGSKISSKMSPNDSLETLDVRTRQMDVLYTDAETVHVMDPDSYEQLALPRALVGELVAKKITEGEKIRVVDLEGAVVTAMGPDKLLADKEKKRSTTICG